MYCQQKHSKHKSCLININQYIQNQNIFCDNHVSIAIHESDIISVSGLIPPLMGFGTPEIPSKKRDKKALPEPKGATQNGLSPQCTALFNEIGKPSSVNGK